MIHQIERILEKINGNVRGRRALVTLRRIWIISPEACQFFVHGVVLAMGLWLWSHPLAIERPIFASMYAVHKTHAWWWTVKYLSIGSFGLVALFLRCYYWLQVAAISLEWLLWVYTTLLVQETRSDAVLIVFFVVMLMACFVAMTKTFLARPRKPSTPEAQVRLTRIRNLRGVHVQ